MNRLVRVRRFDSGGELKKPIRMDNGWLRVEGCITRAGIFKYVGPDGTIRRELRPPEEVFRADSMASFNLVPFTNDHPFAETPPLLNSENTGRYQCGAVEMPRRDGMNMLGSILATDAAVIKEMEHGKVALSPGYECDYDPTPGVWNGEEYDGVQRNIVANHVALCSVGRAGDVARLRMDSADAAMLASESESGQNDSDLKSPPEKSPVKKIRIDSVEVEVPETAAALFEKFEKDQAAKLKAAVDAGEVSKARADSAESDVKKLKAELAEAPKKAREQINARVALETAAVSVLGSEVKLDSLSDRDVKLQVLAKLDAEFKAEGKSDAYIDAAFDYQTRAQAALSPAAEVARAEARTDSAPSGDPIEAAQAKFDAQAAKQLLTK